jgi:hypothetical protein
MFPGIPLARSSPCNALVIEEKYLSTKKKDSTHFWLYRANWILYGGSATAAKDKIPGWHFVWNSDFGTTANSIELFVSMDGKCMRLPTM